MNKYICFYDGKQIEIEECSAYSAQLKAEKEFQKHTRKKVRGYKIAIILVQVENREIIHKPGEF